MTSSLLTAITTSTGFDVTRIAALVVLAWIGYQLVLIWWFPWAPCRRCRGAGRHRSPNGRNFRPCRHCKGSGRRLRLGRALWNWTRT